MIGFLISLLLSVQPAHCKVSSAETKLLNEPCGKVSVVKYGSDSIQVILRPLGAKSNRGEIFKKQEFDLEVVSQVALEALKNKTLMFCAHLNDENKMEFYVTK